MTTPAYRLVERPGHWLLGALPAFREDRLRFLVETAAMGPIVRFRLAHRRFYMLSDPDLIQEMLVARHRSLAREPLVREVMARTMGNGLLTSDGEYWKRQRRMIAPAMHLKSVGRFADLMVRHAEEATARWRDGQEADVEAEMDRVTLGIVSDVLFRIDMASHADTVADSITALQEIATRSLSRVLQAPAWLPTPDNLRQKALSRRLRGIMLSIIRERRTAPDGDDLLSMLLQSVDAETGERMTDEQVCDEAVTLYLAGYDTTALTLAYCWYELARHPDIEARFHHELESVLGGRRPRLEDVARLDYTRRLFKETLRLYPPAYFSVRLVADDIEIGGHPIAAGSVLMGGAYAMHRKPDLWEEPERFDPERFADEAEQTWHKFRYFPFGGGPRICIGNQLALLEGPLVLATIGRRFRFALREPGQRVSLEPQITLGPAGGLPLRVLAR